MNVHRSGDFVVIAMSDQQILGKRYEEGNFELDINPDFYGGKEIDVNSFISIVRRPCTINAVGTETTEFLQKKGIITKESIKTISNIPYTIIIIK